MRSAFHNVTRRAVVLMAAIMFTWGVPVMLFASSSNDEDLPTHDARLDNYPDHRDGFVLVGASGTALMWFLLALLALLCIGVMFKSANRSHLD